VLAFRITQTRFACCEIITSFLRRPFQSTRIRSSRVISHPARYANISVATNSAKIHNAVQRVSDRSNKRRTRKRRAMVRKVKRTGWFTKRERERRTNEWTNGDERFRRARIYDARTKRNEGNGDDGKSCRDWHVWNASVGYSRARCFDSDPVYICSKTPREGGQLTRVAHAKKGPQYAPCKPPDRCRHRRINFSPILTEIDLTSDEPDENGKKKAIRKNELSFHRRTASVSAGKQFQSDFNRLRRMQWNTLCPQYVVQDHIWWYAEELAFAETLSKSFRWWLAVRTKKRQFCSCGLLH